MNKLSFSTNKKLFALLILITLFGGFLRFHDNTINPPSLNIDEVAYGYSAYSILKTGKDEWGKFLPLTFESVGDYKSPVLIYLLVPSIALFGLNEFGVRFTTVLVGTLSIPVFFLLLSTLLKNSKVALIGSALLSISPWHIYYSRYASDSLMGVFILMIGVWFFQKMLEKGGVWIFMSAFTLVLSMYTYHSEKFFVPLFIAGLLIINLKKVKQCKLNISFFLLISLFLLLPLIYISLFGSANKRAGMVFLSVDIDYTRYVILDHLHREGEDFLLFFFWIKRYLNYFQPDFLFFTGLNMVSSGMLGLGVLYLFELPWLVLGIVALFKNKVLNRWVIILWVLLGIIPAALTNNEQNTGRSLLILPALLAIIAIGADIFIRFIYSLKNRCLKIGIALIYSAFILIFLIHAFLVFTVHFPQMRGEDFMEGTKQSVEYALKHQAEYEEIIFDPYRGIYKPNIFSVPYLYVLFYSKYDPAKYQSELKRTRNEFYSFDKFTFRKINWQEDRIGYGKLFIGSPWMVPLQDISQDELKQMIYLSNNKLALLVVSPIKK